jgi:ABC-type transport system involved in multi-copper enzyme maturation permease subunit
VAINHIVTIAHLTIAEARRRRIVFAAVLCTLAFLAFFAAALFFAHRDMLRDAQMSFPERQMTLAVLTVVGFFAANFLSVVFALLLPIDTLSGEIDSGVMQTLASKPLDRAEIVLGKWAGHLLIAFAYLLVISAGIVAIVRAVVGFVPVQVAPALPLMLLEITLLVSVSVAGGARLNTIANGVVALAFYAIAFVGGFVEQIGAVAGIPSARTIGILVSLISPADALWRLAVYYMQPALVRGLETPLTTFSLPTFWMVWWAAGFTVLTLVYGVRTFSRRNL